MEPPNAVSTLAVRQNVVAQKNSTWQNVAKIALKVLSVTIIAIGSMVALAGAIVFTNRVISTGLLEPLLLPCIAAAKQMAHLSSMLLSNNVTALGAIATFPLAGACLTPFLIPASIGAIPGVGIISLGVWMWKVL